MRLFDHFLTNFTAGELSPHMLGRTDVERYYNGCLALENFIVLPTGGVVRRPGTRFVAPVLNESNPGRLIPFVYSMDQSYMLEFGDREFRVCDDGGVVVHTPSSVPEWASGVDYLPYNFVALGGLVYRCIAGHTSGSSDMPGSGADWQSVWVQDASLVFPSPYAVGDLGGIKFAQSADVMYLVHPDYPPHRLSRRSPAEWAIEEMEFSRGPFLDECFVPGLGSVDASVTVTGGSGKIGDVVTVTATASSPIFSALDVGRLIKVRYIVDAESKSYGVQTGSGSPWASASWEVDGEWEFRSTFSSPSGKLWFLQFSHDSGATWRNYYAIDDRISTTIEGETTADDLGGKGVMPKFRIYTDNATSQITWNFRVKRAARNAVIRITGYVSPTVVTGKLLTTFGGLSKPIYTWALGAWGKVPGYPRCVTFHAGRLWFGGTYSSPNRLWASAADDFSNFDADSVVASGALDLQPMANEVNAAVWMTSRGSLVVGTSGDEWILSGDSPSPETPPAMRRETNFGSEDIQAVVANGYTVFVQRGGRIIRHVQYDWSSDTYYAFDITAMSDHVCGPGVSGMAYLKGPWSSVWFNRKDGGLLGLTYMPEQKVSAWHRHDVGGVVEDVACVSDEIWLIVRRVINGQARRYIEVIDGWGGWGEGSVYLDCAAGYSGAPASVISGLDYLEGANVEVVADGRYIGRFQVTGGAVSLPQAYSDVWVGLGYTSKLRTINIEHAVPPQTTQGTTRRTVHVILRLVNTIGGFVGFSDEDIRRIQFVGKAGDPLVVSPELFSGDTQPILVDAPAGYGQYVTIVQPEPYPMEITAIILRLVIP